MGPELIFTLGEKELCCETLSNWSHKGILRPEMNDWYYDNYRERSSNLLYFHLILQKHCQKPSKRNHNLEGDKKRISLWNICKVRAIWNPTRENALPIIQRIPLRSWQKLAEFSSFCAENTSKKCRTENKSQYVKKRISLLNLCEFQASWSPTKGYYCVMFSQLSYISWKN